MGMGRSALHLTYLTTSLSRIASAAVITSVATRSVSQSPITSAAALGRLMTACAQPRSFSQPRLAGPDPPARTPTGAPRSEPC